MVSIFIYKINSNKNYKDIKKFSKFFSYLPYNTMVHTKHFTNIIYELKVLYKRCISWRRLRLLLKTATRNTIALLKSLLCQFEGEVLSCLIHGTAYLEFSHSNTDTLLSFLHKWVSFHIFVYIFIHHYNFPLSLYFFILHLKFAGLNAYL